MAVDRAAFARFVYAVKKLGPGAAAREFKLPRCPACGTAKGAACHGPSGNALTPHRKRIVKAFARALAAARREG